MQAGQAPGPGPPAEVHIYVLGPNAQGRYALMHFPRRSGDTQVCHTPQGAVPAQPAAPREVMWVPHDLSRGQMLSITEKATSPSRGHFGPIPNIHAGTPFQLSGPTLRGPHGGARQAVWCYDITLSDGNGVLAKIDPDIIIIPDP